MFWEVWAGSGKKGPDPQYCSLNNLTEFFSGSDTNIKTQVRKVLLFLKKIATVNNNLKNKKKRI